MCAAGSPFIVPFSCKQVMVLYRTSVSRQLSRWETMKKEPLSTGS